VFAACEPWGDPAAWFPFVQDVLAGLWEDHAEMEIGADGVIMLAEPSPDYQGPARHAETCEAARRWLALPYVIDGAHVYVDDVDAHFAQARESGATILSEPADSGHGRSYRAADLEGHRWMFDQRPSAAT